MPHEKLNVIGELMNNSYARARKAWSARDVTGYQELARIQTSLGASYLTLNVDGTQKLSVTLEEMIEFLPRLIPAIQHVTDLPLSFDNPHVAFHRECVKHFDRSKARGRPILNSLAISREDIDGMIQVAQDHDMMVIVMVSECLRADGSHGAPTCIQDMVNTTRHFADLLQRKAGIGHDRIIVDPGLAPVASDTTGLVNQSLDAIRAIRSDPSLNGIHISVGLSNFAIGAPKPLHIPLERAFLRLAMNAGMDFALANPEKNTEPLSGDDPFVSTIRQILESGRKQPGESQEDAGFRQLDALMELWSTAV